MSTDVRTWGVRLFGGLFQRFVTLKAGSGVTITESVTGRESTLTIAASGGGGGGGGGGVTDHTALTSLTWTSSGHIGPANRLFGSDGAGAAAYYQIGSDVQAWSATLDAVTAGTYTGSTSITTLGTVVTGTWSATAIGPTKGGTGLTSYAEGDTLYASATNTLAKLAAPTSGQRAGKVLGWSGDTLAWVAPLLVGVIGGRDIIVEARAVYDVPGCTTVERP